MGVTMARRENSERSFSSLFTILNKKLKTFKSQKGRGNGENCTHFSNKSPALLLQQGRRGKTGRVNLYVIQEDKLKFLILRTHDVDFNKN
jgi:hypothetical protein